MAAPSLADVFRVLNRMKAERVLNDYALVGAMAALFHAEATRTYDLDVAVALPESAGLVKTLTTLYDWLRNQGFHEEAEHVWINGVPVQLLAVDTPLWQETILEARSLDYEGEPVRVAGPEHLIALAWESPSPKRRERAATLLESPGLDRARLRQVLARHAIRPPSGTAV